MTFAAREHALCPYVSEANAMINGEGGVTGL